MQQQLKSVLDRVLHNKETRGKHRVPISLTELADLVAVGANIECLNAISRNGTFYVHKVQAGSWTLVAATHHKLEQQVDSY